MAYAVPTRSAQSTSWGAATTRANRPGERRIRIPAVKRSQNPRRWCIAHSAPASTASDEHAQRDRDQGDVARVERELERLRVGQVHDRRQPAEAHGRRHHQADHHNAEGRLGHERRDDRRDRHVSELPADREDAHHVAAPQGSDGVCPDAGQVRPHRRAQSDPPVGERCRQDAAPDARPHEQAQKVQQERDGEGEQPRVAEAIAVRRRGIAQLFQGVLHRTTSCVPFMCVSSAFHRDPPWRPDARGVRPSRRRHRDELEPVGGVQVSGRRCRAGRGARTSTRSSSCAGR